MGEQAIEDYTAALKLQPAHYKALHNRAFALDKVGRLEDALADYSAAIHVSWPARLPVLSIGSYGGWL